GGRGRLRAQARCGRKARVAVEGRPILDWTIAALPGEVDRLVVVTNYLAEQIDAYLAKQSHIMDWTTVRQKVPRGTGDALRVCRPHIRSNQLLVLNGDDLYGAADLATLAARPAGILAHPVAEARKWGVVTPKADGSGRMERLEGARGYEGTAQGD